ncbi:adenylate cyclase [Vespertiliibacter pulmonis]|uniref:CYTH domain-containing protein n=1 Tax=Vespertiliibacter pulmonis TaxID=1443036 RepID=A0A3N4W1E3_9PAST|nr:CYTH domain-containing protein [Vespertiliibacter pulmonis]QLB20195.1 adenylate cyclase [Vespertiliibacter pulmonis]RPE86169.1 CYTH domain-containing protein [Vespertiliibacter pulmonis]
MQDEIELKIMLSPKNIPIITQWIQNQNIIHYDEENLENTYFDSQNMYFEKHQMGLRVRTKNNHHQLTLKMKGDIVGGLHIRPEYNLTLADNKPDFKRLVSHYNLQFADQSIINTPLFPLFSTNFLRYKWLIHYQNAEIEIALDQGLVKNKYCEDTICEIEFELKKGNIHQLFQLLNEMPKKDGMWLSSLSKAQRGYFIGNAEKIDKEIEKLTACNPKKLSMIEQYQFSQILADFIRLYPNDILIKKYQQITQQSLSELGENYLLSSNYLLKNIKQLNEFYR